MSPLLPLAYDRSRIDELTNPHSIVLSTVVTNRGSELDAMDDLFDIPTVTPSSDPYSETSSLPYSSSSSCLDTTKLPYLQKLHKPQNGTIHTTPSSDTSLGSLHRLQKLTPGNDLALDREGKVYGIKLADDTFPMGYRPSLYDDPTFFVVQNSTETLNRASEVITRTFERDPNREIYEAYMLDLDRYGLKSLPEQINDFRDLVIFNRKGEITPPCLQLFASNNELRSISPKIFEIGGLEILVLRNNKIARVPSAIGHAKSLRNINIAQNKIKFFPHTILNLDHLEVLTIRPNQLIEAREVACQEVHKVEPLQDTEFHEFGKEIRYTGELRWITKDKLISGTAITAIKLSRNLSSLQENTFSTKEANFWTLHHTQPDEDHTREQEYAMKHTSWCPKLSELASRRISEYLISQSEIMKWKDTTHERMYKMAIKALIHKTNGETCGYCKNIVVESVAELMEWWDFKDCSLIPIKRNFCSKRCALLWWEKIAPITTNEEYGEEEYKRTEPHFWD
ncbi:hypothetical protein FOA43_001422 [Brettanomyces nanus]|uniref:Uncharacterized protein n=1 Tax=Eeniella nana TaxID=13502 RepID=A0A875RXC5_EENNA|nr:uncharacterized protein FOA43_001422 [Brettanomyces nanus]QPG74101.1 hypothetical protein FOA43_001422 [Brettanomyces nanus]